VDGSGEVGVLGGMRAHLPLTERGQGEDSAWMEGAWRVSRRRGHDIIVWMPTMHPYRVVEIGLRCQGSARKGGFHTQ
jgi:hypothetical protein